MPVHACTRTYTHVHAHTRMYTHIHACTRTCVHTCAGRARYSAPLHCVRCQVLGHYRGTCYTTECCDVVYTPGAQSPDTPPRRAGFRPTSPNLFHSLHFRQSHAVGMPVAILFSRSRRKVRATTGEVTRRRVSCPTSRRSATPISVPPSNGVSTRSGSPKRFTSSPRSAGIGRTTRRTPSSASSGSTWRGRSEDSPPACEATTNR